MTTLSENIKNPSTVAFYGATVLFNLCLIAQVLTVGLAYFYQSDYWQWHVWLVRSYAGLSLVLAVWVYFSPFPKRVRSLASSLPVLLALQFLTIHLKTPIPLGIIHPLIGFSLFSASTTLVHRVSNVVFPKSSDNTEEENAQNVIQAGRSKTT